MDIREIRRYNLRQLVKTRYGGVTARLAEKIGRQASYVARVLSDNSEHARNIGEKLAREIEEACDLPVGFLDELEDDEYVLPTRIPNTAPRAGMWSEVAKIPWINLGSTMGLSVDPAESSRAFSSVTLRTSWLRQLPSITDPTNIRLITGAGDSMHPSISHGDLLLVDIGITPTLSDGVYVFTMADQVYIKRLQREPDGFRVLSDNPRYREILVPAAEQDVIQVHGRVVYCWSGNDF
ncbi:S24 family peptidase [Pseudomonas syringae]|uniref:S24 family peptidase n=1 Tax=Pseudomonas syringae TaxID=317 RepID=UPI0018A20F4E|nr:S24 family peptidase [Pseudomonas syringae]